MNAVMKPKLQEGALYLGDNGGTICLHCAGASAKYTGCDISGKPIYKLSALDIAYLKHELGCDVVSCESGCTSA